VVAIVESKGKESWKMATDGTGQRKIGVCNYGSHGSQRTTGQSSK